MNNWMKLDLQTGLTTAVQQVLPAKMADGKFTSTQPLIVNLSVRLENGTALTAKSWIGPALEDVDAAYAALPAEDRQNEASVTFPNGVLTVVGGELARDEAMAILLHMLITGDFINADVAFNYGSANEYWLKYIRFGDGQYSHRPTPWCMLVPTTTTDGNVEVAVFVKDKEGQPVGDALQTFVVTKLDDLGPAILAEHLGVLCVDFTDFQQEEAFEKAVHDALTIRHGEQLSALEAAAIAARPLTEES
jgi:hypothetical protein